MPLRLARGVSVGWGGRTLNRGGVQHHCACCLHLVHPAGEAAAPGLRG